MNYSLEKNQVPRELALMQYPLFACWFNDIHIIWWKLKMSYHTAYPNLDSQAVVCHLFFYSFTLKAAQATGVVNLELAPALFLIKKVWFLLY
jgi:hypothetical protein